jgi:hypothetical protein
MVLHAQQAETQSTDRRTPRTPFDPGCRHPQESETLDRRWALRISWPSKCKSPDERERSPGGHAQHGHLHGAHVWSRLSRHGENDARRGSGIPPRHHRAPTWPRRQGPQRQGLQLETTSRKRDLAITASAAPFSSTASISFVLTTRVDRVHRDRNTALLADSLQEHRPPSLMLLRRCQKSRKTARQAKKRQAVEAQVGKRSRRSTRFPSTKPVVPTGTCVASLVTALTFQSRLPSRRRAMPRESVNNETSNARKMSKLGRDCSRYQDRYGICWKLSGTAGRTVTTTVTCPSVGTGGQGESVAHHRS